MAIILLVKTLLFQLSSRVFLVQTARPIKAKLSIFSCNLVNEQRAKSFFKKKICSHA